MHNQDLTKHLPIFPSIVMRPAIRPSLQRVCVDGLSRARRGIFPLVSLGAVVVALTGCTSISKPPTQITQKPWGQTKERTPVLLFTLRNTRGAEARISNYGG